MEHRLGQTEALCIAVRQRAGTTVSVSGQAQAFDDAINGFRFRAGPQMAHGFQILADRELRIRIRGLNQIPDRTPRLPVAGVDPGSQHARFARGRLDHSKQQANGRGLAGTIEPEERIDFSTRDTQRQAVNGRYVPVSLREMIGLDGGVHLNSAKP